MYILILIQTHFIDDPLWYYSTIFSSYCINLYGCNKAPGIFFHIVKTCSRFYIAKKNFTMPVIFVSLS